METSTIYFTFDADKHEYDYGYPNNPQLKGGVAVDVGTTKQVIYVANVVPEKEANNWSLSAIWVLPPNTPKGKEKKLMPGVAGMTSVNGDSCSLSVLEQPDQHSLTVQVTNNSDSVDPATIGVQLVMSNGKEYPSDDPQIVLGPRNAQ